MDVTHILSFGRLKYVHVLVGTFSEAVYSSTHTGEKSTDMQKHLIQAFSVLAIPEVVKTDNGPTYASKAFGEFLQQWSVEHKKGIPYSPTGQAMVERTHQTLKRALEQQREESKIETPSIRLSRVLFTINFLNCSFEDLNPPVLRRFQRNKRYRLTERPSVLVKNPETRQMEGPYELISWGQGYTCVSTPSGLRWVPQKWVKPYLPKLSQWQIQPIDQVAEAAWRRHKCGEENEQNTSS